MTTAQLKAWQGDFGKEYTDRSVVDIDLRAKTFSFLTNFRISSILEVGCGKGYNLAALSELFPYGKLYGIDPLDYALEQASLQYPFITFLPGDCFNIPSRGKSFDLVFTSGVLMHVAPQDLPRAIDEIKRVSRQYVLIIEYFSPTEVVINYRGNTNLLWKRDYSRVMPNLIDQGFWGKDKGFDDCNFWLFEVTK